MLVDISKLDGSYRFCLNKTWNKEEVIKLPSRTLAYIGDSVFELGLRMKHVLKGIDDAGRLHNSIVKFVSSSAQAELFYKVFDLASQEEQILLKTWRNAKMPSRTGSGTKGEYARATAFEAWVAYLFLTGQNERLYKIFDIATERKKDNNEK